MRGCIARAGKQAGSWQVRFLDDGSVGLKRRQGKRDEDMTLNGR